MPLQDVLNKFFFGFASLQTEIDVTNAITTMYSSNTGKMILDEFVTLNKNITVADGAINTGTFDNGIDGNGQLTYSRAEINDTNFINLSGNTFDATIQRVVIHELIHAVKGTNDLDTSIIDEDAQTGNLTLAGADYVGETVYLTNTILTELGASPDMIRASYLAATSDSINNDLINEFGRSDNFTSGTAIDLVITAPFYASNVDTSANATDDLILGFGNNIILTGAGDDYIYGGLGSDNLDGGDGADHLFDGGDNLRIGDEQDILNGGAGNDVISLTDDADLDIIIVGEGFDYIEGGGILDRLILSTDLLSNERYEGPEDFSDTDPNGSFSSTTTNVTHSGGGYSNPNDNVGAGISILGGFLSDFTENGGMAWEYLGFNSIGSAGLYDEYTSSFITTMSSVFRFELPDCGCFFEETDESTSSNSSISFGISFYNLAYVQANFSGVLTNYEGEGFSFGDDSLFIRVSYGDFTGPENSFSNEGWVLISDFESGDFGIRLFNTFPEFGPKGDFVNASDFDYINNDGNYIDYNVPDPTGSITPPNPGNGSGRITIGTLGDDDISGDDDENTIFSSDGNDEINGLGGDDFLEGGAGNDIVDGGSGNDVLIAGTGQDSYNGGAGVDTLDLRNSAEGSVVNLETHQSSSLAAGQPIDTVVNIENVDGSDAADEITGDSQANVLSGNAGDDTISGGAGDDNLNGGEGSDTYIYNRGDGDDIIVDDRDTNGGTNDRLLLNGIAASSVSIVISGNDFILTIAESSEGANDGGTITLVASVNDNGETGVEFVEFENGPIWDRGYLRDNAVTGITTDGNDIITGSAADNVLSGGLGNDTLDGRAGNDTLNGGAGNDLLITGEGTDTYNGGSGTDTIDLRNDTSGSLINLDTQELTSLSGATPAEVIGSIENANGSDFDDNIMGNGQANILNGRAGDDTIDAGSGNDSVNGGDGADLIFGDTGHDVLFGDNGNDTIFGDGSNDSIFGGLGDDTLNGGTGHDYIEGGTGNDIISDGSGDDEVYGDDGDDYFIAGSGENYFDGGDGIDTLDYTVFGKTININLENETTSGGASGNAAQDDYFYSIENLVGTRGGDIFTGSSGDNVLDGFGGNDTIDGGAGNDTLLGNTGHDELDGNIGDDELRGGTGNDTLQGGVGNDLLFGDGGNDTILDGEGDDTVDGGSGHDVIIAGTGANTYDGGTGFDTLDYSAYNIGLNINLNSQTTSGGVTGNEAEDDTFTRIENVEGTSDNDILTGNTTSNVLNGNDGDDIISDLRGDDTLNGGLGDDLFIVGTGSDSFEGSGGSDTLSYAQYDVGINIDLAAGTTSGGEIGNEAEDDTFNSIENVEGTSDDDILTGNGVANTLNGHAGDDIISGGSGLDVLDGGDGNDTLNGGTGDDVLFGGDGDDLLDGGGSNDTIQGGAGVDTIIGNSGNDAISGGQGSDILSGGTGVDTYSWLFDDITDGTNSFTDTISDFSTVDIFDLSALGLSDISDITFTEVNGDTSISVNIDGASYDIAVLEGRTGLDAQELYDDGLLSL